jgi:hypothetical protein
MPTAQTAEVVVFEGFIVFDSVGEQALKGIMLDCIENNRALCMVLC